MDIIPVHYSDWRRKMEFFKTAWFWLGFVTFIVLMFIVGHIIILSPLATELKIAIAGLAGTGILALFKYLSGMKTRTDVKIEQIEKVNCEKLEQIESNLNEKFIGLDKSIVRTLTEEQIRLHDKVTDMFGTVKIHMEKISCEVSGVANEMREVKMSVFAMEEARNKREVWSKEFDIEWKGLRDKFEDMRDSNIRNLAIAVKEELRDHFMEILSWNLKTEDEHEKASLVKIIFEKIDNTFNNIELLVLDYYPEECRNYFKDDVIKHILTHKDEVRLLFQESLMNNLYRQYHRSSQSLLNRTLNSLAVMFLKYKTHKDGGKDV